MFPWRGGRGATACNFAANELESEREKSFAGDDDRA